MAAGAVLVLAGCVPHFKEEDSYNSMFRGSNSPGGTQVQPSGEGDPFTFGGIAEGTGGLVARQSYATDDESADPRDATQTGKLGEIAKQRGQTPDVKGPIFEDLPPGLKNNSMSTPPLQTPTTASGDKAPVDNGPSQATGAHQ